MPAAQRLFQCAASTRCGARQVAAWRAFSHQSKVTSDDRFPRPKTSRKSGRNTQDQDAASKSEQSKDASKKPSLVEQLFPEEFTRHKILQKASREIPRLPLSFTSSSAPRPDRLHNDGPKGRRQHLQTEMEAAGPGTAVLVLRNASPNLTPEDFRRLIPQGRHIEGWTLSQGDILRVIPMRDLATLQQQNVYYLLFSSKLSAFTYQGHVTRIHNLAASHTPSNMSSPIAPPPGYMREGLDVHAAIAAYALVPPGQKLELRQLREPLSPMMQSLVRNQGFPSLVKRKGKMPFEARLMMDGPQLQPSIVRHILLTDGRQRGLSWSGGEGGAPAITRWEPQRSASPQDQSEYAFGMVSERTEKQQRLKDAAKLERSSERASDTVQKRRTAPLVYVLGFHTEKAAKSFVCHWHRRPLELPDDKATYDLEGDAPPVANVQLLW